MLLDTKDTIHFTDFSFIKYCTDKYGINRGIYNTIDAWFYKEGITNIIQRRVSILSFLKFVNEESVVKKNRRKFGPGGLTKQLQVYSTLTSKKR
ncbi:hypothetical protein [Aquibacillus albus]|uniref:Uncharacterized protein n=1 Tax=Aquibacillus albus TaxID=1168171 RepID=A0ABS2N3I7_9BACI|nr:hypothetical protein [Aquibacillus albus]MBM7572697.1 hypothetical protein [Aquibacillus albus]